MKRFRSDQTGASLAEFALLLPVLLMLTFGMMELGYLGYQVQQGSFAAKRAVRVAATRELITPGSVADCGPVITAPTAGTPCGGTLDTSNNRVSDTSVWVSCPEDDECGADIDRIVSEVASFYPRATSDHVEIELSGANLGFQGMGRPVPMVTVRFVAVPYNSIFFGNTSFNLPDFASSMPAEDITNGPGGSEFY